MFPILSVCVLLLCVGVGQCSEGVSSEDSSSSGQVYAVGGVLLLVSLVVLVALCLDNEVQHTALVPPAWTNIVCIDPSINTGFKGVSDGFRIVNPNCVYRTRTGDHEADGAKWGAPLNKGKHLFEIHWPRATRHTLATVGVGTADAPLFLKPKGSLVGCNRFSWGLDIARYKCLHRNNQIVDMPDNKIVPDTFFMYVDCESRTLGFGTAYAYWGAPINIPQENFPVFPMVGSTKHMSQITMMYKGSALDTVGDTGYNVPFAPPQVLVPVAPPQAPIQQITKDPEPEESDTYVAPVIVSGM